MRIVESIESNCLPLHFKSETICLARASVFRKEPKNSLIQFNIAVII